MATESLFSQSSLALIASGGAGKDGKVYSIRPTDGTGDFAFSRGSNLAATRVGADGLIEKGRENLLRQSNQFDTTWTQSGLSVTSGQSGYDGTNDAWLQSKTSGSYVNIAQSVSISGVWTLSIYAKANTLDSITFRNQTNGDDCDFDLTNGTTSTNTTIASSINLISNGWYKCSATFSGSSTQISVYLGFGNSTAGSVFIQDAQLEQGLVATPYIETGGTTAQAGILEDTPRFDYSGGATCPSLLLEPSRANLLPYSEYIANYSPAFGGVVEYDSTIQTPQGVNGCYTFYDSDGGPYARIRHAAGGFTLSDKITASVFVKGTPNSQMYLGGEYADESCIFNLQTKTLATQQSNVESYKIEDYGNGWTRYSVVSVFQNAQGNGLEYSQIRVSGNSSNKVPLWGWQLEAGSYATSYIPNHSGGTITRAADSAYKSGQTANIGQTEGTLFLEVKASNINSDIIGVNQNVTNGLQIFKNVSNFFKAQIYAGGTSISLGDNTSITDTAKVALVYKSGDSSLFVNGAQVQTSATTFTFSGALDLVQFQGNFFAGIGTNEINQTLFFPTALSYAELTELTTI